MMGGLALSWYRKADWPRWLEIDPDFEPDYDYWLARSEGQIAALEKRGIFPTKVVIDPEKFLEWCRVNNHEPAVRLCGPAPPTNARALYAAEMLMEQERSGD
jgi:hypothetical protein